jgi:hypothetical protein
MNYLIYFGIVAAAGGALMFWSDAFRYEVSRMAEAVFERTEYRLALRAWERESFRSDAQIGQTNLFRRAARLNASSKVQRSRSA